MARIAFENFPLNCKEQAVMFCVTTYSAVTEGESIIYTQSRLSMFSVDPVKVYIQGVPVSVFLCIGSSLVSVSSSIKREGGHTVATSHRQSS